jgi:predicted dienelactone hydrolase
MRWLAVPFLLAVLGCGSEDANDSDRAEQSEYEASGPNAVGHVTFELTDAARSRTLLVTAWYPATESARQSANAGEPIENLVPAGPDRDAYVGWLAGAPESCTTPTSHSAADAALAEGSGAMPVIAFSHCHNCIRFSAMSIAERLASHGFVVVAPDHTGNTMFDELPTLDPTFLTVRAEDVRFLLDRVLDGAAVDVPEILRGRLDPARVGVLGHSFGGVTAGLVIQDDPRPLAGMSLAAPMENPLLAGVKLAQIDEPLAFLVAEEDHSIGAIGNSLIQTNFESASSPVYDVKLADTGHWSFTDICALRPQFAAGCGSAQRQENSSETFEYLPVTTATAITQAYVTAFFSAHVLSDPAGLDYLRGSRPAALVTSTARE